jgi:quercetin dioxygenase-like cupin family protein
MNVIPLSDGIKLRILSNSDALTVSRIDFPRNAVSPQHKHPHEEVNVVFHGRFAFTVGGVLHTLGPGESVTIAPNTEHFIADLGEGGALLSVWTPSRTDLMARLKDLALKAT